MWLCGDLSSGSIHYFFDRCCHPCMVSCVLSHICVVQGHMHCTAGGWREECSLHIRVLRVQLSLKHIAPLPSPLSPSVFPLPLPSLCPYCILAPPSPLSSPLLPFISPPSPVHSWPTVRVFSCSPAVLQSSSDLSCSSRAWTWDDTDSTPWSVLVTSRTKANVVTVVTKTTNE